MQEYIRLNKEIEKQIQTAKNQSLNERRKEMGQLQEQYLWKTKNDSIIRNDNNKRTRS